MTRDQAVRYVLDRGRKLGLEVEVLASESREMSVSARNGAVNEMTQAIRGGLGIRAVTAGKVGYAWSEDLSREALDWIVEEARENALLQDDEDGFLPEGDALGRHDLLSEGLSAPVGEKVDAALALEQGLRQDPRYGGTQAARYFERETRQTIASTRAATGEYRNGFAGLSANFVMRQGESVKQGGDAEASKEFFELDPTRTAQEMLDKTGRLLGARALPTGRYRAYLEPRVVAKLVRVLMFSLSGKSVAEGKSRLGGKLGTKIASDLFTLVDDPRHPLGLSNRPFDSEGTPTARLTLIEAGTLRSFLHNSATARKTGQENTGHAYRSYAGTLDVASSNLQVSEGAGVDPRDGVLVTDLMGVHAGANAITGDISLQAFGLRFESGESYPVENFVISGNLFRMLEAIVAVGASSEVDAFSGVIAPHLEIEDLSFGGA